MWGNETSKRFGCILPAVKDYLSIWVDTDREMEHKGIIKA